jgi:hypothetical protein
MSAITRVYDLIRNLPAVDKESIINKLSGAEMVFDGEVENKEQAEALHLKLEHLEKAIAALKTAPAQEDKRELTAFVESLIPVMAYALNPDDNIDQTLKQQIQKQAIEHLHPLFQEFRDIYANQYSENALEELRKSGKSMNPKEKAEGQKTLENLNMFCNKKKAELEDETNMRLMQDFLLSLNAQTHPALFNHMVKELHAFRRENTDNFQRFLEKFGNTASRIIKNQGAHGDYLQDWQQLGYLCSIYIGEVLDVALCAATGKKLPFDEAPTADQNTANDFMPINGVTRRRPQQR